MLACSAAATQPHAQSLVQSALLLSRELCVSLRLCSTDGQALIAHYGTPQTMLTMTEGAATDMRMLMSTCNGHASQGAVSDAAIDLCIAADARQHVCAELEALQQRWVPLPRVDVHEAGARCVGDIRDKDAACTSERSFFAHVTGQIWPL